ncbi:MAG: YlbF family regulator [Bacilli bacterium]|nr:YlbF family regulator [Bacilli bacterium]
MIEEKQKNIINKLNNSDEIKRFKELETSIKNNSKYNELINNFKLNEELYKKENRLNDEIIKLRKELFEIDGVKEYLKLESDIRILSKNISKIISNIVDNDNCK